jgi:ankyrin repeat protein
MVRAVYISEGIRASRTPRSSRTSCVWFDLPMLISWFSRDQLCAEDYRGLSALHIAMEIPNPTSVVNSLLGIVDVDHLDRHGRTALHVVVSQFRADGEAVIQRLCEKGAKIDKPDKEGRTALHLAMLNPGAAQRCIHPLLELHASPRARDFSRQTPLHIAAAAPRYVRSRASENPECQGKAAEAYCRAMNALLARQSDTQSTDWKGNTPLHLAADKVNAFAVEHLLKRRAFVNAVNNEGCTPLHLAIKCNLPGCRRNESTILEQRYRQLPIMPGGQRKVFTTPEKRDQHLTVKYLILNAASINTPVNDESQRSPLHLAALSCCNEAIFKLLIENNAAVNAIDAKGNTALHLAAMMAPIKNPEDPVDQWRISWTSFRQIIRKLIADESDLHALHQIAEKNLHFISSRYAGTIAAGAPQDDKDDLDHPFTAWFEQVKKLLCSKGARIDWTNDESQNVLACTAAFWSSWIQSNYREMAVRQTTVCELYTEWIKISKL